MEVRFLLLGLMGPVGPGVAQRPYEKFKLFRFKNPKADIYSLSIKCNEENELKPEEFELLKDSKVGRNIYTKIYMRKSGKVKCCVSLKSPKDTIPIDELVEENFEGSCILRLYHAYLGSTKSITLSIEEILVKKMDIMESYFDDLSDESDSEED